MMSSAPPVDPSGASWGNGVGTNFGISISSTGTSIQRHKINNVQLAYTGIAPFDGSSASAIGFIPSGTGTFDINDQQQHDRVGRSATFRQRELLRHRRRHSGLRDGQGECQQQHHSEYGAQRHLHPNARPSACRRQLDDGFDGQEQHCRADQRRRRLPLRGRSEPGGNARHPYRVAQRQRPAPRHREQQRRRARRQPGLPRPPARHLDVRPRTSRRQYERRRHGRGFYRRAEPLARGTDGPRHGRDPIHRDRRRHGPEPWLRCSRPTARVRAAPTR